MISVVSLLDEEKDGVNATCVISSNIDVIVPEIEAILSSLYRNRPDEFMDALGDMMERIEKDAKNNTSN